jgi:hypothetical protein
MRILRNEPLLAARFGVGAVRALERTVAMRMEAKSGRLPRPT